MPAEPSYLTDTCEELLDLSRANAQAILLATAAFLHDADLPVHAWTSYLGEMFAKSWDEDLDLSAGEFLDAMLTNYRSLGAEVLEATLDGEAASATIAGFPKPELCRELGIDCDLAEDYLNVPEALALGHGIEWRWERNGPRVRLHATRQRNDQQ